MKKLAMLLCCAAMLTTLAGCKDAVANISNSSEVLIQVGSTKITKGDIYDSLKKEIFNTYIWLSNECS